MSVSSRRKTLLLGTLILALSGIGCRILGFLYRIFLSRMIGAEALGIYQLAAPVYALMLSFGAGGMQTVLSRMIASSLAKKDPVAARRYLFAGITLAAGFSAAAAVFLFRSAGWIGVKLLFEPRTILLLQILSLGIFPSCVHNVLASWYLAKSQTGIPSLCQLLEQLVRIGASVLAWFFCCSKGLVPTGATAAIGTVCGELFSLLFLAVCLSCSRIRSFWKIHPFSAGKTLLSSNDSPSGGFLSGDLFSAGKELSLLHLPLTLNRILLNVLHSIESALLPGFLIASGLSRKAALSQYGILTGMALPMIFFPSAITHAFSTMLLPDVARSQAEGSRGQIAGTIRQTLVSCLLLGIFAVGIFFSYGPEIGRELFGSREAGIFLQILSFLSPFLYLETTLASILNGLGKTSLVFFQNLAGNLTRILAICLLVPPLGIRGCLYSILASELITCFLAFFFLSRETAFSFPAGKTLWLPSLFMTVLLCFARLLDTALSRLLIFPRIFHLLFSIAFCFLSYLLFLKKQYRSFLQ